MCLQLPLKYKLLFSSAGIEHLYYDINDMIACNVDCNKCVMHRFNKCSGIEKACKFIQNTLNWVFIFRVLHIYF